MKLSDYEEVIFYSSPIARVENAVGFFEGKNFSSSSTPPVQSECLNFLIQKYIFY